MTEAQHNIPFDSRAYILDEAGQPVRFILDPLDEVYTVVPRETVPAGMLPEADFDVRAALADIATAEVEVLSLGLFATFARLPSYRKLQAVVRAKQDALAALVASSPEHKAAMRRIVNTLGEQSKSRKELARYIA